MTTEKYIEELLYRYNCVVVPEFGAFLSQMKSAVINKGTNTFYPPSKVISFNEQLTSNDGLLVSYMSNAEKTSYEAMLQSTHEKAKNWKKQLRQGERLSFPNLGELWLNREGKMQFQPSIQINFLTSSFGLASVVSPPVVREVLKNEVVALEEKIPFIITPEKRKQNAFRPYFKYAAVVLLAVSTGITGYQFFNNTRSAQQLAAADAQELVNKNIQEATFFNSNPIELPPLTLDVSKKIQKMHHVIAGAFRVRENADKKVRQLKRKGYNAAYLGTNKFGLHQVTYGSFAQSEEALKFLKEVKQSESNDAWLLSLR